MPSKDSNERANAYNRFLRLIFALLVQIIGIEPNVGRPVISRKLAWLWKVGRIWLITNAIPIPANIAPRKTIEYSLPRSGPTGISGTVGGSIIRTDIKSAAEPRSSDIFADSRRSKSFS